MAGEPGGMETPQVAQPTAQARPMSRRKKRKLFLAVAVIIAAAVIVFWGWSATGRSFLGVSDLLGEVNASTPPAVPAKYINQVIELQGKVDSWYGGTDFMLVDKSDTSKSVSVHMLATFPDGFAIGKTVVVKGTLNSTLPLAIQATEITVGCASKY